MELKPSTKESERNEDAYGKYSFTTDAAANVGYWPSDPNSSDGGWFWRKAIPNKLIDAINSKVTDEGNTVDVKGTKELLDAMYEYNIGQTDKWWQGDYNGFVKYVPVLLNVKNHWCRDISFKGCYEWDTSEAAQKHTYPLYIDSEANYAEDDNDIDKTITKLSSYNIIYLEEESPGAVKQIKEGKKTGEVGAQVKKLLYNENGDPIEYYKYNGSERSRL